MHRFFIDPDQTVQPDPKITGSEANHIINTLRLKPGDGVGLFDGSGFEYEATIVSISKKCVCFKISAKNRSTTESALKITIGQSFLKERKMDGLVRQLTELGISKWIPVITKRSVARPDPKRIAARVERWSKIAQEAVKQCCRTRIPEISTPMTFDEVLARTKDYPMKIIFWEEECSSMIFKDLETEPDEQEIIVLIGPEGGFEKEEVEKAKSEGFQCAGLGPRILRAETATISACTIIQYRFGDMNQKKA